jgi:hypothetical protein
VKPKITFLAIEREGKILLVENFFFVVPFNCESIYSSFVNKSINIKMLCPQELPGINQQFLKTEFCKFHFHCAQPHSMKLVA